MKDKFDIWEVGIAQWPQERTDGKGEQLTLWLSRQYSNKYFMQTCFQAESLKDLAGLNIEILFSYVCSYNM